MKYLVIDANNIANQAFHRAKSIMLKDLKGLEDDDARAAIIENTKKGLPGFSMHFFFNKIHSFMKTHKGFRVLFVWDGRYGSVWRKQDNVEYKSNRSHDKDEFYSLLIDMMNGARDILEHYPVLQFTKSDAEADDLIYSIVKVVSPSEVKVISTDTDMIQLPQAFPNVTIWDPKKKKNHIIPEYNYVLFKSVMGDKSDKIDGVPGYGKVKSARVAEEGTHTLTEDQMQIVENNLRIIDLSKNPSEEENTEFVRDILNTTVEELPYSADQIKKEFFNLKLKQQVDKFGSIAKVLKSLG
jgi:5'-3' exonuclease